MSEGDNYVVWLNGNEYHRKRNKLHRADGPAVIYANGDQYWYKDGKPYTPTAHELMTWKMNEKERATY